MHQPVFQSARSLGILRGALAMTDKNESSAAKIVRCNKFFTFNISRTRRLLNMSPLLYICDSVIYMIYDIHIFLLEKQIYIVRTANKTQEVRGTEKLQPG